MFLKNKGILMKLVGMLVIGIFISLAFLMNTDTYAWFTDKVEQEMVITVKDDSDPDVPPEDPSIVLRPKKSDDISVTPDMIEVILENPQDDVDVNVKLQLSNDSEHENDSYCATKYIHSLYIEDIDRSTEITIKLNVSNPVQEVKLAYPNASGHFAMKIQDKHYEQWGYKDLYIYAYINDNDEPLNKLKPFRFYGRNMGFPMEQEE